MQCVHAVRFYMHDRERRCFKFEAPYTSRIIGIASIANGKGATAVLSFNIKSLSGKLVFESQRDGQQNGKFAFTTPDYFDTNQPHIDDDYGYEDEEMTAKFEACLVLNFHEMHHIENGRRSVEFWIRPDSGKRHPMKERKASETSIETMNNALEDMQYTLTSIVDDLAALQQRERRLVNATNLTSSRLLQFAVVSIVVLLITSTLQFVHFKTYFKTKKLI